MKKFIFIFLFICYSFTLFAQVSESEGIEDLDSLFAEAEDIVVEEQKTSPQPIPSKQSIEFSGFLDTDVGAGFSITPDENFKPLGYFAFENYTYISARASDIFGIKASLKTLFPNFSLSLHEIFFDYLLLDFLYIRAGKYKFFWNCFVSS